MGSDGRRPSQAPRRTVQDDAAYLELVTHLRRELNDLPCLTQPNAWTSDDPEEQTLAARSCTRCPALAACRDYALTHHERSGVWGGLTPLARLQLNREEHPAR